MEQYQTYAPIMFSLGALVWSSSTLEFGVPQVILGLVLISELFQSIGHVTNSASFIASDSFVSYKKVF